MNPLCECSISGWCARHQMEKQDTLFALCKGMAPSRDCGHKYWQAWERGFAGATAPPNPVPNPPPFCDPNTQAGTAAPCNGCSRPVVVQRPTIGKYVANGMQALMRFVGDGLKSASDSEQAERQRICSACPLDENGNCRACGCILSLKTQARLEGCPAGKWFPDMRPARPLNEPRRNLIMHVMPLARTDVWKWNLRQIAKRQLLFNGKKCLAIAVSDDERTKTASADEVIAYSHCLGLEWDRIEAWNNNPNLREVLTFPWLLQQVKSDDPNEVTFSCHSKGAMHAMDSIPVRWGDRMYRVCLDDWASVQNALERYSMAGSFRSFGEFRTAGNNRWHYSGTFYWFRHDDVFSRDWKTLDQQFFGTESWPGRMFKPEETACLFADNTGSPYDENTWRQLEPQIEFWEGARG